VTALLHKTRGRKTRTKMKTPTGGKEKNHLKKNKKTKEVKNST
jgi:hypothetical protein